MVFRKIIMVMAALLLWSVPAASTAEESLPAATDPRTAPCKGLKPYNNLDELLYQFYINLDSDCLFEMSVEELEKIWGVKILYLKRLQLGQPPTPTELRESSDFENKPYETEKDAFFLEVYHRGNDTMSNEFSITITNDYYEKHATLFPDGNFPRLLPDPKIEMYEVSRRGPSKYARHPKNPGKYMLGAYNYCWLNLSFDSLRGIRLGGEAGVTNITIYRADRVTKALSK